MTLESAKGLPAYNIPQELKKQSWAKKRRRRKKKKVKEWKRKVDTRMKYSGEIDYDKKQIKINPRKRALLNTIIHEELHKQFPNKPEKWIYKKADEKEKKMGIRQQIRLLLKYKKT